MTKDSKYFDSIRLSSRKNAKKKSENYPTCYWRDCNELGKHKAPAGREREGVYFFFCLEHVREYNKNFNYFSDLSQDEINKLQKNALTGNRPTFVSGQNPTATKIKKAAAPDFATIRSGSAAYHNRLRNAYRQAQDTLPTTPIRHYKALETKAFMTLNLKVGATADEIKSQYKTLLKIHHPDLNNGDRSSEKRFQDVLKAYNILKNAGFC